MNLKKLENCEFDNAYVTEVHIKDIKAGDEVYHDGYVRTVCKKDLKKDKFMGVSLFGDNYMCGHKPVQKVLFKVAMEINGKTEFIYR